LFWGAESKKARLLSIKQPGFFPINKKPPGQQSASGRFVNPATYVQTEIGTWLQNPSALNDADQDHNNGNDEQNMDQAAHGI
jgi:hypothetical protein